MDEGFVWAGPYSHKLACVVCGRTGYPGGRWAERCRAGHAPCARCGRQFALTKRGNPQGNRHLCVPPVGAD